MPVKMAASISGVLSKSLQEKLQNCKVLVVGAGGIGCELLKNLVLMGFNYIEVIDLDTIDVSNLNRQFLFRKEHVGLSKAKVARESALKFNPDVTIIAYHDSITSSEYGVDFFRKFDLVMNALDNRAARNHVNRMCLAADIPLIESGTAGYLGQVTVIKKKLTECYECQPKPAQKTYPGCTIRNTPSEPIHCIVWAKHLFNQLYGEADPDQDVSPDTEDPEASGDAGKKALEHEASSSQRSSGGIERKSTRLWAEETGYDASKLFNKFFRDDIAYLLSMENLWKKRRPPTPVDIHHLPETDGAGSSESLMRDQRVWSIKECADVFSQSVTELKKRHSEMSANGNSELPAMLVWDKDDEAAMNFVTSAANIRAFVFGIPLKSKFDIKSMAGNIIPAIATTNAVIAGLIVMEALKILGNQFNKCTSVYLNRHPNPRKKLLVPCALDPPNPKCYVCASKPEIALRLNAHTFTVKSLEDKVLKSSLGMVAPDVEIDDGKGTILISSEAGETEENGPRTLSEFGITTNTRLKCDDFLQEYNIVVNICHVEKLAEDAEFELIGDVSEALHTETKQDSAANGQQEAAGAGDEDNDLLMVEDDAEAVAIATEIESRKRKAVEVVDDEDEDEEVARKRPCVANSVE